MGGYFRGIKYSSLKQHDLCGVRSEFKSWLSCCCTCDLTWQVLETSHDMNALLVKWRLIYNFERFEWNNLLAIGLLEKSWHIFFSVFRCKNFSDNPIDGQDVLCEGEGVEDDAKVFWPEQLEAWNYHFLKWGRGQRKQVWSRWEIRNLVLIMLSSRCLWHQQMEGWLLRWLDVWSGLGIQPWESPG